MSNEQDQGRIAREREFHYVRFASVEQERRDRFYDYVSGARSRLRAVTARFGSGCGVLELGVGQSSTGWDVAAQGASVTSIDISPVAVDQARAAAAAEGVRNISFEVMNAEALTFEPAAFDAVIGSGILHHLDIDRALGQVADVLADDGVAVFYEPLGHNPLINWYRNRTPDMRTDDEHPIVRQDLELIARHFDSVELSMHHCLVIGCAVLPKPVAKLLRPVLELFDRGIARIPGLRWQSWITVMVLSDPKRGSDRVD